MNIYSKKMIKNTVITSVYTQEPTRKQATDYTPTKIFIVMYVYILRYKGRGFEKQILANHGLPYRRLKSKET